MGAHFAEDDRHVSQALGTIPAAPINILAQRAAKNNFPSLLQTRRVEWFHMHNDANT